MREIILEWLPFPENNPTVYGDKYLLTRAGNFGPCTDTMRWCGELDWEFENVSAFCRLPPPYREVS